MREPYIFDIRHSSTSDGPGIRTTVFFKGCNLHCAWCHNPESQTAEPQLAFFAEKCTGCRVCRNICDKTECDACGKCADTCAAGARKLYGKKIPKETVLREILTDRIWYDATGGGVTFSGGECMLYTEYLAALLAECRQEGIHTAVDTAGNVPFSEFEKVMPYTSLFLYDIKAIESELHRKGTGSDNRLILENLNRLQDAGCRILIRVPVIPGFNDGEELDKIRSYIESHELSAEYLPYHDYGESKKKALADAVQLTKKT